MGSRILASIHSLSLEEFRSGLSRTCAAVVFGDRAMLSLSADDALAIAHAAGVDVWLSPTRLSAVQLIPWLAGDKARCICPADLPGAIAAASVLFCQPASAALLADAPEDRLCPAALELLTALTALRTPAVQDWAARLGMSRHRFRRRCQRYFGVSSTVVVWRWIHASALHLRARGMTWAQCASALGFSDGPSIHRAFTRRGHGVSGT